MANNNVQNVRFLRNGSLYETRDAALTGLSGQTLSAEQDGSLILARYGSDNNVKTLVGVVYFNGSNKSLTIFDVEGASGDVEKLRQEINAKLGEGVTSANTATAQLEALSGTSSDASGVTSVWGAKKYASAYTDAAIADLDVTAISAGDGAFIKSVSQADGKVSATTADMPTVAAISETGKAIISVSQSKGTISASAGNIDSQYVDVAYSAITATNVKAALAEIADEINAMDKSASAVDGQVVTTVSEVDGVVSETKANVKDLQLGGYAKSSSTGAIASTDTINEALSKLENKAAAITIANDDHSINVTTAASGTNIAVNIKSGEKVIKLGNDGIYTNLNVVKITGSTLPAEIKERYELRDSDNVKIGESIDIPKDSHIVSINYITSGAHAQNLEYVYIDVSGNTQTTYVDMSELVLEAEFASGTTVTDHVVRGVVDSTSEKDSSNNSFLTVGADGFKVNGIKGEIDAKINALDATVGSQTVATGKHVAVEVAEANGVLTALTVTEDDIASAQGLADEITARGNADTELSNRLGTNVTTTNTASAQLSALSGTSADASGVTSVYGAKAYAKDYADEKVAAVVADLDANVSGNSTHVTVGVKEEDGEITAVTVSESNIANASDLTAEIAARKAVDGVNGDAYTADTTANYISGASSLYGADKALDTALKALSDRTVDEVQVNGKTLAETDNKVNVKISAVAGSGSTEAAIEVNTANNGDVTLQINYIDAGTYGI